MNNFEFTTLSVASHSTKEIVRNFHTLLYKTNPIFLIFHLKTMIMLKNKPNSKPIASKAKIDANSIFTKD
jgi:hypothetical protein